MGLHENLRQILLAHSERYPQMETQDYIKLLYQQEFGCGHMLPDAGASLQRIAEEYRVLAGQPPKQFFGESIGNDLCRLYLDAPLLGEEHLALLNRMFAATANTHSGNLGQFEEKLNLLEQLAAQSQLPLDATQLRGTLENYRKAGCQPLGHSDRYRQCYSPHYRVVKQAYGFFWPAFEAVQRLIDSGRPVTVAIDGRCGSGKTLLGAALQQVFGGNLFHMDDFFLPFTLRTQQRLTAPGGNIHHERFLQEVLVPLVAGQDVTFRAFDCATGEFRAPQTKNYQPLNFVEGSYAHHPAFAGHYDLRIVLTCPPQVQFKRLAAREAPESFQRFVRQWVPMEERYLYHCHIADSCNLLLDTGKWDELKQGSTFSMTNQEEED